MACTTSNRFVVETEEPPAADWDAGFVARQSDGRHTYFEYTGWLELPAGDTREHRLLRLGNGMRVLCISDPQARQSAAALAVRAGSTSDPREYPGMAHALEHMLFLGTRTHPGEHDFEAYLTQYGGYTNASTTATTTHYRLSVNNAGLAGALTRFAGFFVEPLLDAQAIARELLAVESERLADAQSDTQRRAHIVSSTYCPMHAYAQFAGGSLASLQGSADRRGVELRDAMAAFFAREYAGDAMALAVIGGAGVAELVAMAVDAFSAVPRRTLAPARIAGHPLCDRKLGTVVRYQTVGARHDVTLVFALPRAAHAYAANACKYVETLVGGAHAGALGTVLRELGWISAVEVAAPLAGSRLPGVLCVSLAATPVGFARHEELVQYVFAYLRMLRAHGAQAWHFGEVQRTLQLEFYHGERAAPVAAAIALACQLGCPHLRAEHAVSGTRLLYKFDAPGIEALLTLLEPENYRLYLGAREFDDADALPCVDPHLGVAYGETPLPRRLTSEAELAAAPLEHANRLQFPQPNPYIPANVPTCTLQAPAPDNAGNNANDTDDVFQAPVLVRHDPLCELWLRTLPSTGGAMARSSITVGIAPSCVHATARGQALLGLAAWALEHAAAAHLGLARAAGIAWHVWVADHTLCVRVRGHAHLPDILEQTLATLSALDIGDREFAQLQGRALRAAECMRTASPRELVGWQQHCMRAEPRWHFAHCAQELARVGAADLRAFVRDAFARVHVRVLVVGAGAADDARAVGARVVRALDACAPVPRVLRTRMRAVDVAPGVYVLRVRSGQAGGDCAVSYTVSAPRAASRWAQAQFTLLAHMMGAAFFDRLRTQEQLGYMVGCSWVGDASIGAGGLELRVQGTSNPEFVCLRIERFLLEFGRRLEAMGEPELAGHRDALATANLDSPRTAARATAYLWPKILAGSYDFSCVFEVNRQLAALRKADVLEFWRAHVCPLDAQKKSTRVVVQAWADALHMPSDNVLREHPLPVVALHLCLQAAGAHELALSDVSCFVSERTLDEPRIAMAELQRRLAALYRALAPECSDRVCADIAAGHAQLGAALQMALDASRYPGSLLTSQPTPSDTAAPRNAPRTFAGAWIVADYLAFKRMHALHAPCSPAIPLEPLDGCGL